MGNFPGRKAAGCSHGSPSALPAGSAFPSFPPGTIFMFQLAGVIFCHFCLARSGCCHFFFFHFFLPSPHPLLFLSFCSRCHLPILPLLNPRGSVCPRGLTWLWQLSPRGCPFIIWLWKPEGPSFPGSPGPVTIGETVLGEPLPGHLTDRSNP